MDVKIPYPWGALSGIKKTHEISTIPFPLPRQNALEKEGCNDNMHKVLSILHFEN